MKLKDLIEAAKLIYVFLVVAMLIFFGTAGILIDIYVSVAMIPLALLIRFVEKHRK